MDDRLVWYGKQKKNFTQRSQRSLRGHSNSPVTGAFGYTNDRRAGDVFMIRLCDLCDLCVKFPLRAKSSGLDGIEGVIVLVKMSGGSYLRTRMHSRSEFGATNYIPPV